MQLSEHAVITTRREEMERLVDEGYSVVAVKRPDVWVLDFMPDAPPNFLDAIVRPSYERIVNARGGS